MTHVLVIIFNPKRIPTDRIKSTFFASGIFTKMIEKCANSRWIKRNCRTIKFLCLLAKRFYKIIPVIYTIQFLYKKHAVNSVWKNSKKSKRCRFSPVCRSWQLLRRSPVHKPNFSKCRCTQTNKCINLNQVHKNLLKCKMSWFSV